MASLWQMKMSRRTLVKGLAGGALAGLADPLGKLAGAAEPSASSPLFWIKDIPRRVFPAGDNRHVAVAVLLDLMGTQGLKFYRSEAEGATAGPLGLIEPDDTVLIKVNAQWKYRGATNSDLVRGIIQAVLDHPGGFSGEVVIVENGQGRGSLRCDTSANYGNSDVAANAANPAHSFVHVSDVVFADPRVSWYLLDPIRARFIGADDHSTDGYRHAGSVSYPCFTTRGGRRVELKQGIWTGSGYSPKLKLLNIPVLKHHDDGGSLITASLKHFYGLVSMEDGYGHFRHYDGLGRTCGRMVASVRTPSLNIIDAIWVSHKSLRGWPADTTFRANQILASQDPVALDYWAAKYILHPVDGNPNHHPSASLMNKWLTEARDKINRLGGLYDEANGILVGKVTKSERRMQVHSRSLAGGA